jgi:hypothetical protein
VDPPTACPLGRRCPIELADDLTPRFAATSKPTSHPLRAARDQAAEALSTHEAPKPRAPCPRPALAPGQDLERGGSRPHRLAARQGHHSKVPVGRGRRMPPRFLPPYRAGHRLEGAFGGAV